MSLNTTTWMVSDTHWHHDKIRGYCNRPYESMEEMNEGMIQNWNKKANASTIGFLLGDYWL